MYFFLMRAWGRGGKFFLVTTEIEKRRILEAGKNRILKTSLKSTKKVKTKHLKSRYGLKNFKTIFSSKKVCLRRSKRFFFQLQPICVQKDFFTWVRVNLKNESLK